MSDRLGKLAAAYGVSEASLRDAVVNSAARPRGCPRCFAYLADHDRRSCACECHKCERCRRAINGGRVMGSDDICDDCLFITRSQGSEDYWPDGNPPRDYPRRRIVVYHRRWVEKYVLGTGRT